MDTDSNTAAAKEDQKSPLGLAKERHGNLSRDELIWLDLPEEKESEASAEDQARVPPRPVLGSIGNDLLRDLQAWARMYENDKPLSIFGTEMTAMAAYLNRLDNNPLSTVLHEAYPHTLGANIDKVLNFFFQEIGDLNARVFKESSYREIRVDVLSHGFEKIMMDLMRKWNSDHKDKTFDSAQFTTFKNTIDYIDGHHTDDVAKVLLSIWVSCIDGLIGLLAWRHAQIEARGKPFGKLKDMLKKIKENIKQGSDRRSSRGLRTDWRSKAIKWLFS